MTKGQRDDWTPATPREDGVFLAGDELPLNHRLRAEALVAAGATKDPAGIIAAELIADTAARLKAEAAAAAPAKPLDQQTGRELRATASAESVELPAKARNEAMVALIQAARDAKAAAASDGQVQEEAR